MPTYKMLKLAGILTIGFVLKAHPIQQVRFKKIENYSPNLYSCSIRSGNRSTKKSVSSACSMDMNAIMFGQGDTIHLVKVESSTSSESSEDVDCSQSLNHGESQKIVVRNPPEEIRIKWRSLFKIYVSTKLFSHDPSWTTVAHQLLPQNPSHPFYNSEFDIIINQRGEPSLAFNKEYEQRVFQRVAKLEEKEKLEKLYDRIFLSFDQAIAYHNMNTDDQKRECLSRKHDHSFSSLPEAQDFDKKDKKRIKYEQRYHRSFLDYQSARKYHKEQKQNAERYARTAEWVRHAAQAVTHVKFIKPLPPQEARRNGPVRRRHKNLIISEEIHAITPSQNTTLPLLQPIRPRH